MEFLADVIARIVIKIPGMFIRWLFFNRHRLTFEQVLEEDHPDNYLIGICFFSVIGFVIFYFS
jgi:hypothetical protein